MFKKILIANRGEIACRIIRTTKKLGIKSVAIYSTVDAHSVHVKQADEAYLVGKATASASYLNIESIIKVAKECGAEAIHPGYGFLSENADFARACTDANIIFIGPPIEAIKIMGSKQLAKQLLEKTSIPMTPGYHGKEQSDQLLLKKAEELGFPILIKAANGGGGKGMRTVTNKEDFFQALSGARRESMASFADDTMLLEKLIENPRHIELQIMADNFGNVVHLFERDCSIQRRHQKIIEEAPAPLIAKELRRKIGQAAVEVAKLINYRGAGTVEFLLAPNNDFYFMEMNTRLQVEHPVTEMITGLDLVEWQIKIAANEALPCDQKQISMDGHAIECRIYAEDPENNFLPSIGQIHFLKEPSGENIRIDSGITQNDQITQFYDPMIAKLITWGPTRDLALEKLKYALQNYHIGGVKTNIPFLLSLINIEDFTRAKLGTSFLNTHPVNIKKLNTECLIILAASFDFLKLKSQFKDSLQNAAFGWQMFQNNSPESNFTLQRHWKKYFSLENEIHEILIFPDQNNFFTMLYQNSFIKIHALFHNEKLQVEFSGLKYEYYVEEYNKEVNIYTESGVSTVKIIKTLEEATQQNNTIDQLRAPMPGTIVAIFKNKGDKIIKGERIIVLEAMKMEHTLHAPHDGILEEVFYSVGSQVTEGAELAKIEK